MGRRNQKQLEQDIMEWDVGMKMDQLDQLKNLLMYSSYRKMLTQRNLRHQNKLNNQQTRQTKNQAIRKENGDQLKKVSPGKVIASMI